MKKIALMLVVALLLGSISTIHATAQGGSANVVRSILIPSGVTTGRVAQARTSVSFTATHGVVAIAARGIMSTGENSLWRENSRANGQNLNPGAIITAEARTARRTGVTFTSNHRYLRRGAPHWITLGNMTHRW